MQYWHVNWLHDEIEDPVTIFNEIGEDGYETRKIHIYRDGRKIRADEHHESPEIGLGEIPVGDIRDVAAMPEFQAFVITRAEFDTWWESAAWPSRG
ncbi:DUF6881 domain-containing protein [Streptomyces xanthophaeus]|uniref:DUF6881 domain-containing protein n=1 Tax=Streptomyces xanthophaeus TaxID=67385 RepID=UPI00233E8591|nr:hypothetical protein [Streptomyces xanthophaeus]